MKSTALANLQPDTIYLYTLEDAEKIINRRRKLNRQKKLKRFKQSIILKSMSLFLCIAAITMLFISPADGSASVICALVGLTGLFVPTNMVITWE